MLQLTTHNRIILDGKYTKFALWQDKQKTVVYMRYEDSGQVLDLPHKRYSMCFNGYANDVAGRNILEADFRNAVMSCLK